jgi:hypothetical protein
MKMSYYERFIQWQNYTHYVLLALWVYLWHSLPLNEVVEQIYINNSLGIIPLILWWSAGLFVGDTIIHGVFWFLPKPLRWRD